MKVLVTGGAGFIGSHVTVKLLDAGHDVIVYDNLSRGFRELVDDRADFVLGSLHDQLRLREALRGTDAVVHMAGFIIVPESVEHPEMYYQNNVEGSRSLLEAMEATGVRRIVFSSSATVYGEPDAVPLTEDAPIKEAANPYGQTKIDVEALLHEAHARSGLNVTILRYFNPYGPNELHNPETHAVPNFVRAALLHEPIPLYWNGEQVRDFIYVEDLARAHVVPLGLGGLNVYNVGTGRGIRVRDVVETIFAILGYETPIEDLGPRPGDVDAYWASPEKITAELGWRAEIDLAEGLRRTVEFFRSRPGG